MDLNGTHSLSTIVCNSSLLPTHVIFIEMTVFKNFCDTVSKEQSALCLNNKLQC